ncbi:MAG: alginate export family protein [Candidatus Omnitrophota bacterium]|jgi:predicted porin
MSKRLILVLALLFVVGTTFAAYAEVQNVKVSGDIALYGIARNNFDLGTPDPGTGTNTKERNRLFGTQTRLRVDADLTDNVIATVRLINERSWTTESNSSTDIDLDLAYVTLKEFLYSPLSLTLGRQEIRFGNQLIIGNSNNYTSDALNGFPADLSVRNAFDAIRATLNYDPLVIDAVYAKISNSNTNADDDADLFGVNASYDVSKKLNVQGYIWDKRSKAEEANNSKKDNVYTLGALITAKPITDLKLSLEGAWQFGMDRVLSSNNTSDKRKAYALQAMADYTFSKVKFTPSIGAGYTYLSGPKGGKYSGWDPMYYNQVLGNIAYAILPFSNMQAIGVRGSVKPADDVTLTGSVTNFSLVKEVSGYNSLYNNELIPTTTKKNLGNEFDLTATYDYTEDVQLGLTWGYFACGNAIADSRGNASQVIGSMKVTF